MSHTKMWGDAALINPGEANRSCCSRDGAIADDIMNFVVLSTGLHLTSVSLNGLQTVVSAQVIFRGEI